MGEKICFSAPFMVKMGMKARTMMTTRRMIGVPTSSVALTSARSPVALRQKALAGSILPGNPHVILGKDQGDIGNDAEINGANGEQIGGFPSSGHDRKGNRQGKGNHESRNDRRPQVSQEEKEADGDEENAGGCGFQYLFDHGADQVPPLIVRDDLDPLGEGCLLFSSATFSLMDLMEGMDFSPLRMITFPITTSSFLLWMIMPVRGTFPRLTWATFLMRIAFPPL